MSYKNVQLHVLNKPYVFTFRPLVPSSADVNQFGYTTFQQSPRLSSKDIDHLHYGQSFYFYQVPQTSSGVTQAISIPMRISCQI